MGPVLLAWLGAAQAQDCADAPALVERAADALLAADMDGAGTLRDDAEAALVCGEPVAPTTLARMWVVEGVLAFLAGDEAGARLALVAAQRTDPGVWDPRYGQDLTALWSDLGDAPPPEGTVALSPALGEGWTVSVDGSEAVLPVTLPEGVHAVQVHHGGQVAFGQVVRALADETVRISHTLPTTPPEPAADPVAVGPAPVPPEPSVKGTVVVGLGVDVAGGQSLDAVTVEQREPGGKVLVPLEVGAALVGPGLWLRGAASLGPLLGGSYLFRTTTGAGKSPVAVGGHLAGGPRVGALDLGLLVGVQWPARIPTRLVVSLPLGELPLRLEARAGVNVVTDRPVEGAGAVSVQFQPWR